MCMASRVSVSVPIWFTLMRMELAMPSSIPRWKIAGLVTKISSATSWISFPSRSVSSFKKSDKSERTSEQMVEFWANWVRQYTAILSIEDRMSEEDWPGWKLLTARLGKKIQLVGDDIYV